MRQLKWIKILSATLLSTSMMTGFSYLVSDLSNKQFREPELLSELAKRLKLYKRTGNAIDGWVIHYIAGLFFVIVYDRLWNGRSLKPSLNTGAILGAISGAFGIQVWKAVYALHPNPPKIDFKNHTRQLMVAHIIFGIFAAIGYKLPENVNQVTLLKG